MGTPTDFKTMYVIALPALSDNYMYLVIDKITKASAVVDPYNAHFVSKFVAEQRVNLTTILTTHHHMDHAGGNAQLVRLMAGTDIKVVGGDKRVDGLTKQVEDNEEFNLGKLRIKCLHTPCHTTGHICYYVTSPEGDKAVFTGDTLFIGGCGRFFEGTAETMYNSLSKLANLPDETKVFCGHEYTLTNLKFASRVEPENEDITEKLKWATNVITSGRPTIPSTIASEKKTNPFMRVGEKSVQQYAKSTDILETMGYVRSQKDTFQG